VKTKCCGRKWKENDLDLDFVISNSILKKKVLFKVLNIGGTIYSLHSDIGTARMISNLERINKFKHCFQ